MRAPWRHFSLIKCDNISVSTCIRVQLGVIFKSVSVFTAVKGVMFVSGVTDPKWPVQREWVDPSLVQLTDEQWSSSNKLSLPTFLCERERSHACVWCWWLSHTAAIAWALTAVIIAGVDVYRTYISVCMLCVLLNFIHTNSCTFSCKYVLVFSVILKSLKTL